jgi:hypothetical protein
MLIIYCLLVIILLLSVYQLYILLKLKSGSSATNAIPDAKYFELKYQTESYVKIFSVLIALAGFLGYNTMQKSKEDIEKQYVDNLKKYETRLNAIDSTSKENENFIQSFNIEKEAIKAVLLKTGKSAKDIEQGINLLAAKRINPLNLYVVPIQNKATSDHNTSPVTYQYKDLLSFKNSPLPKFNKAPFVDISNQDKHTGNSACIFNVTTTSFDVQWCSEKTFYVWILSED